MLLNIAKIADGGLKADQWRNLVNILPVALYVAWQVDGEIPDQDAPRPKRTTKAAQKEARKEELLATRRREELAANADTVFEDLEQSDMLKMDRNYLHHYTNVLEHCTAIRIWASQTITPEEA